MFGGQRNVPIVIKAFTGRGWGAGHQHAQNLESIFAHVPGLKVVSPSSARNAKGLLISAARDPNPVLVLEHRWLHGVKGEVPEEMYETPLERADVLNKGSDLTLVSWGYATVESRVAVQKLSEMGIKVDHLDMLTLRPLDLNSILMSVELTGRLLVVNEGWGFGGLAGEIIASVAEWGIHVFCPPKRLTGPSFYSPSTHFLIKDYYITSDDIVKTAASMFPDREVKLPEPTERLYDVPDPLFMGPF